MRPMALKPRILIVEDESGIADTLQYVLSTDGFAPVWASTAEDAIAQFTAERPALAVLDVGLPDMNGFELFRRLQALPGGNQVPMLFLTARSDEIDRVVGLELGADDYIAKPFSPRELTLRVQSVLRRTNAPVEPADVLKHGDITVDRVRHQVTLRGKELELTATEFKLLTTLIERRGRVQSRDVLLNDVWGYESAIDTRTVDTHVRRLREKLGKSADCIETIRGFGYRMLDQ